MKTLLILLLVTSNQLLAADLPLAQTAGRGLPAHIDYGQWALSMGLVLLLIVVLAWLMKRLFGVSLQQGGRMKILAGLSLGGREKVLLVDIGSRQVLLGVAPGRVQTLYVLAPEEAWPVTSGSVPDSGFARRLAEALKEKRS